MNKMRKGVSELFSNKSEGFSITIDKNLIETDALGVSFNLEIDIYFSL